MKEKVWKGVLSLAFVLWGPTLASAMLQSTYTEREIDWKKLLPVQSRMEVSSLESFITSSSEWPTPERVHYLQTLVEAGQMLENDSLISRYAEKLGALYREIDSIGPSLDVLNLAYTHAYDATMRRTVLNSLGGLYMKNGDYTYALDFYFRALEEAQSLNDGSEAYPIGNISEVYTTLGEHEKAIEYLHYSLECSNKLDPPEREYSLIYDYTYLARGFNALDNADSALYYINLAQRETRNVAHLTGKYQDACFVAHLFAAEIYIDLNRHTQATFSINAARKAARPFYLSGILLQEARLAFAKGRLKEAWEILNSEALNTHEYSGKNEILKLKAEYFKATGNFQMVAEMKDQLLDRQADTFNEKLRKTVAFSHTRYELLKKNEEIVKLRSDQQIQALTIKNQRFLVLAISLLLASVAITTFFLWRQNRNRKQMQSLLLRKVDEQTRDLQQTNSELRTLNYVASHDLKEPIRNIANHVGLLERDLPSLVRDKLYPRLESMKKSTRFLYTLVEEIGRLMTEPPDPALTNAKVDLDEVASDIFFSLGSLAREKNGKLHKTDLPVLKSNQAALQVILLNLVENGLKFNRSIQPKVEIGYEVSGDYHHIIVTDNGIGIADEHLAQIFDPFKQLHPRLEFQGVGNGLTVAKRISMQLGGDLKVSSQPGEGSRFTVLLPRAI